MKNLIAFFSRIILLSCSRKKANNIANTEYINKQIAERITLLNSVNDSLVPDAAKITSEIDKLILLSKDVENIDASINQSNIYFEKAQKEFSLDTISYIKLSKEMELADITGFIKKNELNLLNKIIMKANKGGSLMMTAQ